MEQFHREIIKSNGFVLIEYIDGRNNFFFFGGVGIRVLRLTISFTRSGISSDVIRLRTIVKCSATCDCG